VFVAVSQPSFTLPLQSPNPALQVGEQVPFEQAVVPFAFVHFVPQAAQLFTLVLRFVSQPSFEPVEQLPKPELHELIEHAPSAQVAVPFAVLHAVVQAPQWAMLVCVFASQPLAAFPSQLPNPLLQVPSVHTLLTHVSLAFARLHTVPHAPQFARLVVRSVSQPLAELPSQSPLPVLQVAIPHTPFTQFGVPPVDGQTCPHAPQLFTSVLSAVSQPSFGLPLQSLYPDAQEGTQAPDVHAFVPCAFVQATPQAPQFDAVLSAVSQPFRALPSQLPNPDAQLGTHAPAMQLVVPFALVHPRPHPPQLATVV
jgi:hypothetical protein